MECGASLSATGHGRRRSVAEGLGCGWGTTRRRYVRAHSFNDDRAVAERRSLRRNVIADVAHELTPLAFSGGGSKESSAASILVTIVSSPVIEETQILSRLIEPANARCRMLTRWCKRNRQTWSDCTRVTVRLTPEADRSRHSTRLLAERAVVDLDPVSSGKC